MVKSGWYVCDTCGKKLLKVERSSVLYNIAVYCRNCKCEWYPTIYFGEEVNDFNLVPAEAGIKQ